MRNYAPMVNAGNELAKVFAMQPAIEQQAVGNSIGNAMRMALAESQIGKYNSETELNRKRLEGMDTGRDLFMQGSTGLNQNQLDELSSAIAQGWQTQVDGPPTAGGQYPKMAIPKPDWATPDTINRFNQARVAMGANMAGTGKTNGEQLVNAMQGAINIGRQDDIISGDANPNDIAKAMAAVAGKPTVDVTSSGIGFNPYGDPNDLNTKPFEQANEVKARAAVDAALARVKVNGNQLPAEAKLVQFYQSIGYPKEKAVEMARSRKNRPLRDLAADLYLEQYAVLVQARSDQMDPSSPIAQWTDQDIEAMAQQQVESTLQFLKKNDDRFGGGSGSDSPPVPGAQKAPDGNWYIQKDGKWFKVE